MLNAPHTAFPILTTEKLTLRQLVINDDQEILTLRSDREINKYLDRQISETIDDARSFINKITESNSFYWAITLSGKNVLIGTICLFDFSDENDKCEIGFELLTNFQGQGIMKEAVEKVIDYAFNIIKVQKIEAFLHKDNQRSIKLLEKLSFRNSNKPDKTNPDLICYKLTMNNLVKHYLDIYTTRKEMQEKGITNPGEEIRKFTRDFVEKLKSLPLDEEIILKDNCFFDSNGNLLMKIPIEKTG